ncbi:MULTISPECIES: FAD-binding oxidoreductase [unclassified Cytobacillus]|uniref:FAD-binding oxidoreductase n=1 Tax=unclassified Cytobacillus TaxID=2675268 RepID=UPI00203AD630|nr:FAD-binding oxidoreductase [Cytobacillus sp. AMY 15.2]MCM3089891.1 FAD-binding oxidoreductase [Cytobacillus sp. AMY 15.2]
MNETKTPPPLNENILSQLIDIFGEDRILTNYTDMMTYSYDASFETQLNPKQPQVAVIALTTEEVSSCVKLANKYSIPLYPRGAATGQTGGAVPVKGGIMLDLSKMNRILEIDHRNMQAIIEPGVIQNDLNEALKPYGLRFPPDPGSANMCTIGGMVSNNSSGLRAVKYGVTRHYVLGMEVVLPTGDVIVTGGANSKALKSVSGYDLAHLMIGSEGTLGIITRLRLKLLPLPVTRGIVLCSFARLEEAGEAVNAVFSSGLQPSAIEIMDYNCTKAVNMMKPELNLPLENEAILVFEVDGAKEEVTSQVNRLKAVVEKYTDYIKFSDEPEECEKLWQARKLVGAAVGLLKPGGFRVYGGEDICVPISRLPETLREIHNIADRYNIICGIYGHVGDGNMHTGPVVNMNNQLEMENVQKMIGDIHELAIKMEGTTTAEHGVGIVRAKYMDVEHGPAMEVMRAIKRTLDPNNILNPGKMALPN